MRREKFKRGIAMIELIFALVIIGITLMSAPMLINQSINSGYVALQQESIAAASAHTNILLSKHWDEADADVNGTAPIIRIPNNIGNNFTFAGIRNSLSTRQRLFDNGNFAPPTNMGIDISESTRNVFTLDDIDDFRGTSFGLSLYNQESTNAEIGDYVDQQIKITTAINFASDGRAVANLLNNPTLNIGNGIFDSNELNPTQIKGVQVTLKTENIDVAELNKSITFHAFSCNLGTYSIIGADR